MQVRAVLCFIRVEKRGTYWSRLRILTGSTLTVAHERSYDVRLRDSTGNGATMLLVSSLVLQRIRPEDPISNLPPSSAPIRPERNGRTNKPEQSVRQLPYLPPDPLVQGRSSQECFTYTQLVR